MKRKKMIKLTKTYLSKLAPDLPFHWVDKLKEPELVELYELLSRINEDDDLIRF